MNITERIDAILAVTKDYEKAHSMEDDLLWEFVAEAANSSDDALAKGARELLERLCNADFPRHCA